MPLVQNLFRLHLNSAPRKIPILAQILAGFTISLMGVNSSAMYIYEPYQSVRSLGMGGVYTFTEHDPAVLFYNPAGLQKLSGVNWTVFNLDMGLNGLAIYNDVKAVGKINGISSLNSLYGKNVYMGADGYSVVASSNIGFGVFDDGSTSLRMNNPIYPDLSLDFYNHYGFEIGGAFPVSPGLSFGVAVKRLTQMGGHFDIMPIDLVKISQSSLTNLVNGQGVGYGVDTGVVFTPPLVPLNPTLSVSWQDVGQTAFSHFSGGTTPNALHDDVSVGTSASIHIPGLGIAGGLEFRHLTESTIPLPMKTHVGAEFSLLNMDFRAGFYQGYPSYGAGIDLLLLQMDFALYTAERGAYAGQSPEQRIQVGLRMDLDFDINFNLTDAGGSKRRLKQRR